MQKPMDFSTTILSRQCKRVDAAWQRNKLHRQTEQDNYVIEQIPNFSYVEKTRTFRRTPEKPMQILNLQKENQCQNRDTTKTTIY
jgi:hypothetical protein